MSDSSKPNDPMQFTRNLWETMGFSLPGMVTPTFDTDELEKRLKDLKAVEGWLKMNLSMLQMTIQNLDMQCTTLKAVQQMGRMAQTANAASRADSPDSAPKPTASPPEAQPEVQPQAEAPSADPAALWPWTLMQQMQSQMQEQIKNQFPESMPSAQQAKPERAKDSDQKNSAQKKSKK